MNDGPEILTTAEAAHYLRVAKVTLEKQRAAGGGPPYARIGRLVRYRRSTLERRIAAREQPTAGAGAGS